LTILSILRAQPTLLDDKSVKQLISIAGNGKLTDGSTTCAEFRELLAEIPAERIVQYADECLKEGFQDSGLALQDIINEVGRRLGFGVTYGRCRGKTGSIGNDGLWELPNGHKIVVEVKTTDAYRTIDLKQASSPASSRRRATHGWPSMPVATSASATVHPTQNRRSNPSLSNSRNHASSSRPYAQRGVESCAILAISARHRGLAWMHMRSSPMTTARARFSGQSTWRWANTAWDKSGTPRRSNGAPQSNR